MSRCVTPCWFQQAGSLGPFAKTEGLAAGRSSSQEEQLQKSVLQVANWRAVLCLCPALCRRWSPAPDRAWLPLVPYTLPSPVTALYIHPLIHRTHGLCFSPNSLQKQGLRHRVYSGPWWVHTQETEPALTGPASGASTCKPVRSNPPLSHAESRLCVAYTSSCCS